MRLYLAMEMEWRLTMKGKLGKLLSACALLACSLAAIASPLDINRADAQALADGLNGVGLTKAEAIVEYRRANGPFQSVDDLALVRGIGQRTVDRNRDQVTVSEAE
jgi:competence protein ComEA